jgi:hypothetical protein
MALKREKVTGGWRKLHKEEIHSFHSPRDIIRIITPRKISWAGHVAFVGGMTKEGDPQKAYG